MTLHAKIVGDNALLSRTDFDRLLELARRAESVDLEIQEDDLPTAALMRLADQGGSFDFWKEEGENIYSAGDGEPV